MLTKPAGFDEIAVPATSLQAVGFPAYAMIAACFSRLRMRMVRAVPAETVLFAHIRAFFVWAESNSPQEDSQKGGVERVFGV
jgi:hypothetical protein